MPHCFVDAPARITRGYGVSTGYHPHSVILRAVTYDTLPTVCPRRYTAAMIPDEPF